MLPFIMLCKVVVSLNTVDEIQTRTKGTVEQQYISLVLPVSRYAEE